ncbi:hypothetical protein [Natrinema soli]|uniref:Uncharacterized protein n=1 Tax=Natrinema soli TaxID=1930624 RepID=A0ABD5SUE6_9EURY|nr:hypothetical protein [Natrinema soli]
MATIGYRSDPDETVSEDISAESASEAETEEGVPTSEEPAGADGVASSEQQQ